ncbi:hypothetical protein FU659_11185 [Paenibacillus sp. N3.4]|nr:hypothetical protein FU659_11185 [Paenibacillus sp. N3.4]
MKAGAEDTNAWRGMAINYPVGPYQSNDANELGTSMTVYEGTLYVLYLDKRFPFNSNNVDGFKLSVKKYTGTGGEPHIHSSPWTKVWVYTQKDRQDVFP